jgi:hypothetical protein
VTKARTPAEDLNLIQSFSSDTPYSDQEKRARQLLGWRLCRGTAACPRALAGLRCEQWDAAEPCMCLDHHHVLDHTRRWVTRDGARILTAEPYDFDGQEFADLLSECRQLGLEASVNGFSPYFPGRAVLIIIRRPVAARSGRRAQSFRQWQRQFRRQENAIGDLACDALADRDWPPGRGSLALHEAHLEDVGACDGAVDALHEAWERYEDERAGRITS